MLFSIVENDRLHFRLWGLSAVVPQEQYGQVGMKLMNEMWRAIRSQRIHTSGTNHWVYLGNGTMFVGVEIPDAEMAPASFHQLTFCLNRYLRHVHVGPYQSLPAVWQTLMTELASRGEKVSWPSLEVYGHASCDESKPPETTILIALAEPSDGQ